MKPKRTLAGISWAAAVLVSPAGSGAETMADPTRPPVSISAPRSPEAARRPVLQSVLITPLRRSAIIDGERVDLGGRFGGAEVIQITETEVVLRSPGGAEVLKMYPEVEKAVKRPDARPAVATGRRER